MTQRYRTFYAHLPFQYLESVDLPYLPMKSLPFLEKYLPTPAIVEIVRSRKLPISHLGVLYRQTFQQGHLIYHDIICQRNDCKVTPVVCKSKTCEVLMFAHATDAYPLNHLWYQNKQGDYVCTAQRPPKTTKYTSCNRVVSVPLLPYLASYKNRGILSLLGIHIEKLNFSSSHNKTLKSLPASSQTSLGTK